MSMRMSPSKAGILLVLSTTLLCLIELPVSAQPVGSIVSATNMTLSYAAKRPTRTPPTAKPPTATPPTPTPPTAKPPTAPSSPTVTQPTVTTFYAHADTPYTSRQSAILKNQMLTVPADAEFVIHLGDLKAGSNVTCVLSDYTAAAALFRLGRAPTFVILGDNDWTDCPNRAEGLQMWKDQFLSFESRYWKHNFTIQRQYGRPDNFAFTHKGTLFIGLNIVGGEVHDAAEWKTRLTAEADWTIALIRSYKLTVSPSVGRVVVFAHANPNSRHAAFFDPMKAFIQNELKDTLPILHVNGDQHEWMYQPKFYSRPSWLRITVTGKAADPLLKIQVNANGQFLSSDKAFPIDRRLS